MRIAVSVTSPTFQFPGCVAFSLVNLRLKHAPTEYHFYTFKAAVIVSIQGSITRTNLNSNLKPMPINTAFWNVHCHQIVACLLWSIQQIWMGCSQILYKLLEAYYSLKTILSFIKICYWLRDLNKNPTFIQTAFQVLVHVCMNYPHRGLSFEREC